MGVGRGGRGVAAVFVVVVAMVVVSWARASGSAARRRAGMGMYILAGLVVMMGDRGQCFAVKKGGSSDFVTSFGER